MQPDSNRHSSGLTDEQSQNIQLLQATVLAGLEGLVMDVAGLRGQVLSIRSVVSAEISPRALDVLLQDLDWALAGTAKTVDIIYDYADRAAWIRPAEAPRVGQRGVPPVLAIRALMTAALVEHLKQRPTPTEMPNQAGLCRIITAHGLRGGKGLHEKTFSRWLHHHALTYRDELDQVLPHARHLVSVKRAREAAG